MRSDALSSVLAANCCELTFFLARWLGPVVCRRGRWGSAVLTGGGRPVVGKVLRWSMDCWAVPGWLQKRLRLVYSSLGLAVLRCMAGVQDHRFGSFSRPSMGGRSASCIADATTSCSYRKIPFANCAEIGRNFFASKKLLLPAHVLRVFRAEPASSPQRRLPVRNTLKSPTRVNNRKEMGSTAG